jgi:hypothetical protein
MGTLLVASTATQPGIHGPQVPASNNVLVTHPIAWDDDAPVHFRYTPCLVKVTRNTSDNFDNTEFDFAVIHTNTGMLVSGNAYTLTTNKTTHGVVHTTAASTLPTAADLAANRCVCVLMLNLDAIGDPALLADVAASEVEGKWPRSAGEAYSEAVSVSLLGQVLDTPGVRALLPSTLRAQIDHALGR